MYKKLFLDDVRNPPDETWTIVRNYQDCIEMLRVGNVKELSLDHDLGTKKTGYDVVKWIEERVFNKNLTNPPKITVHSANPVERRNMEAGIESIRILVTLR